MSDRFPPRHGRATLVATLAVLFAAVGCGLWWWQSGEEDVLPIVKIEQSRDSTEALDEVAPATVERVAHDERAKPGGVYGVLVDSAGEPMSGFRVFLMPDEARDRTDEQGRFAFPDAEGGDCTVFLVNYQEHVHEKFELLPGERREVRLQLPGDHVLVELNVTRDGVPVSGPLVRADSARGTSKTMGGAKKGRVRGVLTVGAYEVAAYNWNVHRTPLGSPQPLIVPEGVARFRSHLAIGGAGAFVRLDAMPGFVPKTWTLRIAGLVDGDRYNWKRDCNGGTAPVIDFLPPGAWTFAIDGRGLLASDPQTVQIAASDRRIDLVFGCEPAAVVKLELLPRNCKRMLVAPDELPVLLSSGRRFPCEGRRTRPHYPAVPEGEFSLECVDREVDGAVLYLPFDEVQGVSGVAFAGGDNRVSLDVMRRAVVDLRVCERGGREWFGASIEVFAGDRRVKSRPVEQPQRFRSSLPPGDYRVVADRDGARKEYRVTVGRRDVRLRLRP